MGVKAATMSGGGPGPTSLISSSEVRFPGGDLFLARDLGLRSDLLRVPLYFHGCSGGVAGLRVAKDIAENNTSSRVLLVASETTLTGWRPPNLDSLENDLMITALFGDGAAAVVLGTDPVPAIENAFFELTSSAQQFLSNSDTTIQGRLTEDGTIFKIGRALPTLILNNVSGFVAGLLECAGNAGASPDELFWAVHPGGPAILTACEKALSLPLEALKHSRDVSAAHGNMSGPTVLFVLNSMRREPHSNKEWGLILGFGPGLTLEGIVTRRLKAES